ncbi:sodium:alanine symporter family protein [Lactonifactor longoviformis]|uniref:Alanine or glycine:cation symporter, AGCS family n=1 Tax=Lactonifactor longoviformis DSM 17459 TaxID=1122155 RepID=A0A1M4VC05_9CLOT|nr:sodium:alanine symporter family protein [Lactonifactor longoviformis]POP31193.1 sodium:alanine symporter family protein [Lactonifactor longoviformis]SHE66514.1 alanine or glycine:cation symporter, AGCS family [Lactonifactor longoviformis DSM 17459]
MDAVNKVLTTMTGFLFGPYMLVIYFGTGIYLTFRTKGIQFRKFGLAFKSMFGKKKTGDGEIRSFWALATALSSCIGVGNIAAVAAALAIGGPGAIFWMWVAAIFGMATKYSEIALAMKYREKDDNGVWHGGAMYVLKNGLSNHKALAKFLGGFFAFAATFVGLISCNMLQTNTVVSSLDAYSVPAWLIGLIFAVLTGAVVIGGVKRLGRVTSILTPVMGCIYLLAGLVILILHADQILPSIGLIVTSAFQGKAATGGFAGATIGFAIRQGVTRGIMSNEAGIGSSAMIHATASVDHPCEQAVFGIVEVFFDTIVVCTMTALVILTTGVWNSGETSAALSAHAFSVGLPGEWGSIIVIVATILFAFSTLLGWSWYAETGMTFLFGDKVVKPFRFVWCVFAFLGSVINVSVVWNLADTVNGLMALPNLISLWIFAAVVVKLTDSYFGKGKKNQV